MHRYRITVQVKYGRFKEHMEICEKLNDIARARSWTESTLWVPTVGVANQVIIEWDYPDLATFEREGEAFNTDAEARALVPALVDCIVEGSTHSELLQPVPTLA